MSETKHFWEYSFDLEEKKLKQYYGRKSISGAYREVGQYLTAHGFDNKTQKQGSCYFTSEEYTAAEADAIILKMYQKLPWLPYCIKPDKEALAVKSEIEYSHTKVIDSLMKNKAHIEKLNQYYDSIGVPDKKLPCPSKKGGKTHGRQSSADRQNDTQEPAGEKNAGNGMIKDSLRERLKNNIQSAHKENRERRDAEKSIHNRRSAGFGANSVD